MSKRTFMYREPGGAIIFGEYEIGESEGDKLHDIGAEMSKAGYPGVKAVIADSGGIAINYDVATPEGSYYESLAINLREGEPMPNISDALKEIEYLYSEVKDAHRS